MTQHELDSFDMAPATLDREWLVTVDTPTGGVPSVLEALGNELPLVQGPYDNCMFVRENGYQRFRALEGSHAGTEGTIQQTPAQQIVFALPPDRELLRRAFNVIFAAHVNEEPTIRVEEVWGSRSKLLDDKDNPNRYWNRPDADELHGKSVGYGAAEMVGWLVEEQGIEPHVAIMDKSERKDGTFSLSDFDYDLERDLYICPAGNSLRPRQRNFGDRFGDINKDATRNYRGTKAECSACPLKPKCCPKDSARRLRRSIHEGARDMAREIADTDAGQASRRDRKKVEMLFAHLKRILKLGRLRLRGPCGASDEFLLAATAQNLRKLAKLRPKYQLAAALA